MVVQQTNPSARIPIRGRARVVANQGQRTPLELASLAVRESGGELVLLTEDHCVPAPDWVRNLSSAPRGQRGAVGGRVEIQPGATATDWAFYFVDFFRYAAPVAAGPSPSLTVCNVAYCRAELDQVRDLWESTFHETAKVVNSLLGETWCIAEFGSTNCQLEFERCRILLPIKGCIDKNVK